MRDQPFLGTGASRNAPPLPSAGDASGIREHLERLMPPGGRARRLVGWGVVAWTFIGGAIVLGVVFRALERVAGILPYLVVAGLVVLMLEPVVRWLTSLGLPRRFAGTLVFAVSIVLVALLVDRLVPLLVDQAKALVNASPQYLRKGGGLFDRLSRSSNPLLHRAGITASSWLTAHAGNAPRALQTISSAGLRLAHAGLVLLLGGFLGFLLLLSLPETSRGLAAMIPPASRARLERPLAEARRIVGGYVRARLIVSAVVGLLATIGLWAIHMPFWLVLGLIVGVANLVPMLGSWIGGVPVAMVALLTKPPSFLLVVLAVIVVSHAVDGFVLSPLILKETTNLHPVITLLAVIVGAEILGFWGILAAIPVAGVVQFSLREWVLPRISGEAPPAAEPAPIGAPASGVPG